MSIRMAYIVSARQIDEIAFPGGKFKVEGQVEALNCSDITCELICFDEQNDVKAKLKRRLPLTGSGVNWRSTSLVPYDAVYIRRPLFVSRDFLTWLRRERRKNTRLQVLYEVPTYPYDMELRNVVTLPLLAKDRANRRYLKDVIDRVVILSDEKKVFDIPTLHISNGIDTSRFQIRHPVYKGMDNLRLLCVATFREWHGIDRLINGVASYIQNGGMTATELHLVGEGPAIDPLKRMVRKLDIERVVFFHGRKTPAEYSSLFDSCNLAVECLGGHRKGLTISSSLKSREYLARGMPFIYSESIDVFRDDPVDFCLRVSGDDSPIKVNKLIEFLKGLYSEESPEQVSKRIRNYAEEHVSMDATMEPIRDYIRRVCNNE